MLQGLQNELDKLKGRVKTDAHTVNLVQVNDYAGKNPDTQNITITFHTFLNNTCELGLNSWIIDAGATTHMCANPKLFTELKQTSQNIFVRLPDNRTKNVIQEGDVCLNSELILSNVLYIPNFKYNLIYVNRLTSATQASFIFYPNYCLLQDPKTEHVLLKGRDIGNLYIFDMIENKCNKTDVLCRTLGHSELHKSSNEDCNKNAYSQCKERGNERLLTVKLSHVDTDIHTWHRRLAHVPFLILQQIKHIDTSITIFGKERNKLYTCEACYKAKQSRFLFLR